nr:hypothetical protein [Tanacetum cinerariifolium]
MDMNIDQHVALDEAIVPHASRLRIGKSNFRLKSDFSSKKSTLQLAYDVLRLTPFYKAFLVTSDVPEIYMQEFWATAMVHHHSIWFKMDNKKYIVNLEYFREMLHICPRLIAQTFDELSFEEVILAFLRFLGHDGEIRRLTDVDSNKLHQPWRSFAAIINKCLSGKSTGYYSLRCKEEQRDVLSKVYKAPPKTKASVRKTKSSYDTTVTPPTAAAGSRLSTSPKGKQPTKASKAKSPSVDDGIGIIPGVLDVPTDDSDEEISWKSSDEEDDDDVKEGGDDQNDDDQNSNEEGEEFIYPKLSIHDEEETKDEKSFDPIAKMLENTNDEGNDEETLGLNVGKEEGQDKEDDEDELYRDVNINLEGRVVQKADFTLPKNLKTLIPSTIATISTVPQAPTLSTTAPSTLLHDLPNFGSLFGFDHRLKTLEANFSKLMQTNQFVRAVSSIPRIIQIYMDQWMNEAVKTMNEQLEAEILTRSSNSSNTSYVVTADLSEMELKKIIIEKIEGNKSIHRSDEQRNLYKALVKAYKSDKIILQTYGDTVTLKRRRNDDADKDQEPFTGSDRGSKRQRKGKEPESTSSPKEKATRTTSKSTQGSKSQQTSTSESATAEEPMQTTHDLEEPSHPEFETNTLTLELLAGPTYKLMKRSCKSLMELEFFLEEVYKATTDQLDWIDPKGQQYPHNLLKPLPLKPNSRGHRIMPFDHFINNDLEYIRGGITSRKYTTSVTKTKASDYGHIKWIEDLVPRTMESARDVYSKRRIIVVTELKIVEWHNYKHLDWITVRRDDDKLYKFKEGDFKRLRIQDIEDMLLLLVQGKLTNLMVEERFAFNVSLKMFTKSIVIQRRVEDLQLGVESYQKKLNLTRPDTYRSDLKHKEAYTANSNPRGFIYQNKDKQNRLMRIDELHKFSDGTLNDVRTALDDRLKGIRMKYLPQTIWRKSDKERAAAMIHAIDKQLKTRRIMRSLERFFGGRLYEEDFRMLQRTI